MSTVVTLLTSAAVGAILAALIRARFEREHEWRRSLSEAAAEFSARLAGASNAVRYAVELAERAPTSDKLEKAVHDANSDSTGETAARLVFALEGSVS